MVYLVKMLPIFHSSQSNSLTRYQKILWGCSFGCKNLLNSTCLNMKFHNYHHTNLRLSHNKINAIEAAAFAGLSRLRVLYLDHNLIANINPSWFQPLNNLRFLYLDSNLLRTLPPFTFKSLRALRHIDLAANQIHNVSDEAFKVVWWQLWIFSVVQLQFNRLEWAS